MPYRPSTHCYASVALIVRCTQRYSTNTRHSSCCYSKECVNGAKFSQPLCCGPSPWQIEREKLELFAILIQVPRTVLKHLTQVARTGFESIRSQLNGDGEEHSDEGSDFDEVRRTV